MKISAMTSNYHHENVPWRDLSAYTACRLISAGNQWCAARWEVR